MSERLENMSNYIVPAAGTTRGYVVNAKLTAGTPLSVDFRKIALDGQPYRPSGVFADNTKGTSPLIIVVNEINFSFQIPAGSFSAIPYPAPLQHSVNVLGNGDVTLVFVDFPVIPMGVGASGSGGSGGAWTSADVTAILQSNADILAAWPYAATEALMGMVGGISADTPPMRTALQSIDGFLQGTIGALLGSIDGSTSSAASRLSTIIDALYSNHYEALDKLDEIRAALVGYDAVGNALPADFDSLPRAYTYTAANKIETESRTKGATTWVKTFTYSGDNVATESAWTIQP